MASEKAIQQKALRFLDRWTGPRSFVEKSTTTESSEGTESSETTETSEDSENSENKEGKESSETGTEHSENTENSETTETSEGSETSEDTEDKETIGLVKTLLAVSQNPDDWGPILKIVEPVLRSPLRKP